MDCNSEDSKVSWNQYITSIHVKKRFCNVRCSKWPFFHVIIFSPSQQLLAFVRVHLLPDLS